MVRLRHREERPCPPVGDPVVEPVALRGAAQRVHDDPGQGRSRRAEQGARVAAGQFQGGDHPFQAGAAPAGEEPFGAGRVAPLGRLRRGADQGDRRRVERQGGALRVGVDGERVLAQLPRDLGDARPQRAQPVVAVDHTGAVAAYGRTGGVDRGAVGAVVVRRGRRVRRCAAVRSRGRRAGLGGALRGAAVRRCHAASSVTSTTAAWK
ncbi:hypothetical protein GCM10020256_36830 [Streptomyces thermocoprophilus]